MKKPPARSALLPGSALPRIAILAIALACGPAGLDAQQGEKDKSKVDLVSVVGCATHRTDGVWMLTNAGEATVVTQAAVTLKELEVARAQPPGKNRYQLIGTAEFVSAEELVRNPVRAEFTTAGTANTTGQLEDGRKVIVKGLLISTPTEKRLNLTSVQRLSDSCK